MEDINKRFLTLRKQYIERSFGRLNNVQKQAVFTTKGPLLILAGAGSGKTTVLVNRIANLIKFGDAYNSDKIWGTVTDENIAEIESLIANGGTQSSNLTQLLSDGAVRPWNILAITFTNKAAGELKARLCAMLGETVGNDINASTFHSSCVKILRREAEAIGFPQSFTIYDSDDQQRAIKEIYKQLSIDDKFLPVKAAINRISRFKDKMISPMQALASTPESKDGLVAKIYEAYQKRLKKAGAMDFDDLIYNTVKLFETNEEIKFNYQKRFKYVLVDEYQDTSVAQFRLVSLLTSEDCNICVVGDDDQSIYRFRGATIENILSFENYYAGAKVIRLEENYRSTSHILDAANCVIKNNQGRKGKTLWTKNGEGEKIEHYEADNEHDEAAHIVQTIGDNLKKGAKLRDHAILYRMNAQSGPIETYFARAGIPYKIVGGQRFFERKEIKDIIAYMSVVANRQDDLRLRRIINEPSRKIGQTTIDALSAVAFKEELSILDVLANVQSYAPLQRASQALTAFYGMYMQLVQKSQELPMDAFVSEIIEITGYRKMLEAQEEEGKTRLENIGQLVSSVKTYADQRGPEASLFGYLEEVALISDLDSYDEGADVVVMMTMHAAKGLEFDYVFVAGLEEGIFPSEMSRFSDEDLEEERRLCYVGITRAKKELFLSSSASRMIFGQTKRNRPSRFLEEIDATLINSKQSRSIANMRAHSNFDPFAMPNRSQAAKPSSFSGFGSGVSVQSGYAKQGSQSYSSQQQPQRNTATVGTPVIGAKPVNKNSGTAYKEGDLVEHKVFGKGIVLKVTPVADDHIVEIKFDTAGVKKTMANYAPLSRI